MISYTPPKKVGRFRIFLASSESVMPEDFDTLPFPLMMSTKMDGVRTLVSPAASEDIETALVFDPEFRGWTFKAPTHYQGGERFALTRSLKDVPNRHVKALLERLPAGLDGEIGVVENGTINFRSSTSAIMSEDGAPNIRMFVFDHVLAPGGKWERYQALRTLAPHLPDWVTVLEQTLVRSADAARTAYAEAEARREEGLIFARPDGYYKPNRATLNECLLIKAKGKERVEITITGVLEEMENTNEKVKDERGLSKRSTHKAGKVGKGRAGKLVGRNESRWPGLDITVASGMNDADKSAFWISPPLGQLAVIEFISAGGYDLPRNPVYKGLRSALDLS